jgi:V-type H+-transporting ATPase subunit a
MPTDIRIYIFLGFFEKQLEKSEINTRALTTATYYARARSAQEIDDLEERLREHEVRILQMNNSHEKLQRKYLQLTELRHVLRETAVFFEQVWINVA